MDEFEQKHGMMKMLLDMLKKSASDEVSAGLQKPEGEGDMHGLQVEKVEVLPDHQMDEPTPEHEVKPEMAEGGYVDAPAKETPYGSEEGHPEKEGAAHEEATESDAEREMEADEENVNMPFASFFGKRKKK